MKHVFAAVLGLLLGAAAAGAVVYFNPLTDPGGEPPADTHEWKLAYALPGPGVLTHTHGGVFPTAQSPVGVAELWEETIRTTVLTSLSLTSGRDGERIWATRISVPSTRTNLIFNGVVVGDAWLISMPGAGSLFATADGNLWPALKDTILRVDLLREPWPGPTSYRPTLVSPASPRVVGATGLFADHGGTGAETFEIAAYDRVRGITALNGRLMIDFDGAGPFAEAPPVELHAE